MVKSKYLCLSHLITQNTPSYGNRDRVIIRNNSSIANGESANSSCWIFSNNHIGTHIDVPRHFNNHGKRTYDYPISNYVFDKVALVDISCDSGHLISEIDFKDNRLSIDIELLLIRTRFENVRNQEIYWNGNPGLDPLLTDYLRKEYPNLRCVGLDFISITSWLHRAEGKTAHQKFLCPENGLKEILIIEDMSLKNIEKDIVQVIVAPLFVEDGNGAAVTVFAKI